MIKDIVVHADPGARAEARLELAITVARQCGAHLIGLHVRPLDQIPAYAAVEMREAMIQQMMQAASEREAEAKALFERLTAGTQLSLEWRGTTGYLDEELPLHARYADLAIIGQPETIDDAPISRIPLVAGRPVLVVPYAGRFDGIGRRVLVGWDGGREATRAVNDALPFLTGAEQVTVLSVNATGGWSEDGALPAADIAGHLARHGVKVEAAQDVGRDISIADVLLSRASDMSADLIVTGAYGHSRMRELVLGGVTRSLLQHMTVPVLMSH